MKQHCSERHKELERREQQAECINKSEQGDRGGLARIIRERKTLRPISLNLKGAAAVPCSIPDQRSLSCLHTIATERDLFKKFRTQTSTRLAGTQNEEGRDIGRREFGQCGDNK